MPSPTLNLSSPISRASITADANYSTWQYSVPYKLSFSTRMLPDRTQAPIVIAPSNFTFQRFSRDLNCKFLVIGNGGFFPIIFPDPSAIAVLENKNHSSFNIRTSSSSYGALSISDPNRDWSGQLRYENNYDRWVFAADHLDHAFLTKTGSFFVGRDPKLNPSANDCKLHISSGLTSNTHWGTATVVFESNNDLIVKLRTDATKSSGFLFSDPGSTHRLSIKYNHSLSQFAIDSNIQNYKIGFDSLGSIIFSSITFPYALMPLSQNLFYFYGQDSSSSKGPHWKAHTNADQYPLFQNFNYAHDNIALSFDCYREGASWKSSSATGNFQIHKSGGNLLIKTANFAPGLPITFIDALQLSANGNLKLKAGAANTAQFQIERYEDDSCLFFGNLAATNVWRIAASYNIGGSYQPIAFYTSALERLRIAINGNISFPTDGVVTSYGLHSDLTLTHIHNVGLKLKAPAANTAQFQLERYEDDSYLFFGNLATNVWRIVASYNVNGSYQPIAFYTSASRRLELSVAGNIVLGTQAALATNATDGFTYIPTCAGTPTGVPTAYTGKVAMVYDTTNNKFYIYNGAWKSGAAFS
jgi:hypothetical protein